MEEYKPQPNEEVIISKTNIAEFARLSYKHESGTKKAVDEGLMTVEELEIYHYINAWTNQNMPDIEDNSEFDNVYFATLEKAFLKGAQAYSIGEEKAREIHEKIRHISRVARES